MNCFVPFFLPFSLFLVSWAEWDQPTIYGNPYQGLVSDSLLGLVALLASKRLSPSSWRATKHAVGLARSHGSRILQRRIPVCETMIHIVLVSIHLDSMTAQVLGAKNDFLRGKKKIVIISRPPPHKVLSCRPLNSAPPLPCVYQERLRVSLLLFPLLHTVQLLFSTCLCLPLCLLTFATTTGTDPLLLQPTPSQPIQLGGCSSFYSRNLSSSHPLFSNWSSPL